ncbi:MAG: Rieske (2Fe-2S) protein [Gemmatimonadaceae bacterium]
MPNTKECTACPIAEVSRRRFLRDAALAAAATMAALGLAPGTAFAAAVRATAPLTATRAERTYEIPPVDSVAIDTTNEVILVRWHGSAYAFALACPHRGTSLEWHADEARVFCPKHKARFRPDGAHDSGRESRNLDRYDIRRQGNALVVALGALRRADVDPVAWAGAVVSVG